LTLDEGFEDTLPDSFSDRKRCIVRGCRQICRHQDVTFATTLHKLTDTSVLVLLATVTDRRDLV